MDTSGSAASTNLEERDETPVGEPWADADQGESIPSERLRKSAIDCAAMIEADSGSWADAAAWLQTLPMCWTTVEKTPGVDTTVGDGQPWMVVGLSGLPVKADEPPSQQLYVYDNEAETNRIQGPTLRRLLTAWSAATHRFLQHHRGDDRYFDFGLADARRIVLLAALTLNRDFDGAVVGLGFPWEHPADCGASFEGRGWAWASVTSELFAEQTMLGLIEEATDYLRRMTPGGAGQVTPTAPGGTEDGPQPEDGAAPP
jgi:hypothetical protein